MKKIILTLATITLSAFSVNAQGYIPFEVQHAAQSTDGDINLLIGKPAKKSNNYQNTNTYEYKPTTIYEEDKTITLKNGSYSAKTVDFYVKEGIEWVYLQSVRIPGSNSVTYSIGKYEYYYQYGYVVQPVSDYNIVKAFYSSTITLY